jgi:hypothetical protein
MGDSVAKHVRPIANHNESEVVLLFECSQTCALKRA